jgi:hypothetical protein
MSDDPKTDGTENADGTESADVTEHADGAAGSEEEFAHSNVATGPRSEPSATPPQTSAPASDDPVDDVTDTVGDGAPAPTEAVADEATDGATDEGSPTGGDEPPPTTPAVPAATPERQPRSPVIVALAVATAVLFVTTVLFGLMAFAPSLAPIKSGPAKLAANAQEEKGIEEIARRFATSFVTINYKTIDADLDRMEADATSAFGEKLRRTIEVIGEQFKKRKASSSGRALDAAVISHTDDSALVQVLLRRTKKNVGTEGPETGNQIVNVTLVKTPDGWKVDDLTQMGAEQQ